MYHSGKNPLKRVTRTSEQVVIPKGIKVRRLHKAFLRYHDPENWPVLRDALKRMGRADLIGNGRQHLIPAYQPVGTGSVPAGRATAGAALRAGTARAVAPRPFRTQHTGLPKSGRPRAAGAGPAGAGQAPKLEKRRGRP
jgi:hypothetical protein